MPLPQLRRVRWAVRATLTLGVAASVVANVLHAQDNPISQAIAAWPPLALLLTVELISRVPVHHRSLAVARLGATATIAGIAAWVSYWHMAGVAARYGETGASPYLLPLSVDGLIVVASICLVELGGRISAAEAAVLTTAGPAAHSAVAATTTAQAPNAPWARHAAPDRPTDSAGARLTAVVGATRPAGKNGRRQTAAGTSGGPRTAAASNGSRADHRPGDKDRRKSKPAKTSARPRRPLAETVALAAAIAADRPSVSDEEVAQELGISTARLRAVRRQARELELAA